MPNDGSCDQCQPGSERRQVAHSAGGEHESRAIIGGMTGAAAGIDLLAAFARARKRAERHMIGC